MQETVTNVWKGRIADCIAPRGLIPHFPETATLRKTSKNFNRFKIKAV